MKPFYRLLVLFSLFTAHNLQAQFGPEKWVEITHEVPCLAICDSCISANIDSLLFGNSCDKAKNIVKNYMYIHLFVNSMAKRDCEFKFRTSNYPYQSDDLIGYYMTNGIPVFVYGELPAYLIRTQQARSFTYTEHFLGDFRLQEDDMPTWIIQFGNDSLRMLCSPYQMP